jgi:hypothetical protein
MSFNNDRQANCLAITYNLMPRRNLPYVGNHNYDTGMYEPDHFPEAETRCMVLAHIIDHTNIIIKYNPTLNFTTPCLVTGTLTPDSAGNYWVESEYKDKPSYVLDGRAFFIWWDGIDSWIISNSVGWKEGPYWSRTDPTMAGNYTPCAGAIGTATVVVSPE